MDMGPIGSPETSVRYYQYRLRNIPEAQDLSYVAAEASGAACMACSRNTEGTAWTFSCSPLPSPVFSASRKWRNDIVNHVNFLISWSDISKKVADNLRDRDNKVRELVMIKVQHTSLLNTTEVTFKVPPLGSYAPMPAPSPPFKTVLEVVLWNGLQSCRCITTDVSGFGGLEVLAFGTQVV